MVAQLSFDIHEYKYLPKRKYSSFRQATIKETEKWKNSSEEISAILTFTPQKYWIATHILSLGGIEAMTVSFRRLFRFAMQDRAWGIVFVHNHPLAEKGGLSLEDIDTTLKLRDLAGYVGMRLLRSYVWVGGKLVIGDKDL